MVKDGWTSSSCQVKEKTHNSGLKDPKDTTEKQAHHVANTESQTALTKSGSGIDVWGVYESREKFIEMHIC